MEQLVKNTLPDGINSLPPFPIDYFNNSLEVIHHAQMKCIDSVLSEILGKVPEKEDYDRLSVAYPDERTILPAGVFHVMGIAFDNVIIGKITTTLDKVTFTPSALKN